MKFSGSVDNETDDFDGSDIGSAKDPSQGALYCHCLYTVCSIYIYKYLSQLGGGLCCPSAFLVSIFIQTSLFSFLCSTDSSNAIRSQQNNRKEEKQTFSC